jgi:hypothetical protein
MVSTLSDAVMLAWVFSRMTFSVLPAFDRYPKEASIIGRILAGYTGLELAMMNCVQVIREDFDTVLKTMFRTRSEGQRIDIADAFGRHHYHKQRLGTHFETAISSMRHCLKIRNQFAHCIWYDALLGHLTFTNLEEIAHDNKELKDLSSAPIFYVDVPLLEEQENYIFYTGKSFSWINYEGRRRAGKISIPAQPVPKQMKQPRLRLP